MLKNNSRRDASDYLPGLFRDPADPNLLSLKDDPNIEQVDTLSHAINELFDIEHPWLKPGNPVYDRTRESFIDRRARDLDLSKQGVWVYYPWASKLVHIPEESVFVRLRGSRNRNLVTEKEQKVIQSKKVGIAGMSVGSNILNALVLTNGPRHLKIADFDEISIPNLNRIMAPIHAVGLNKATFFARKSFEVDPYLNIDVFNHGLATKDFDQFFKQPKLDLFIEEMDNPYLKIQSRKVARAERIPVIMAADNGDGVLIDVERFDLEPESPLFHGWLDDMDLDNISENLSFSQKLTIIANMVRLEQATPRAQNSLEEVGTVLNTWPQLGTAALLAGVALTFVTRRILLGQPMPSGRYSIGLEEHLVPNHNSSSEVSARKNHTNHIMSNFRSFQHFIEEIGKIK
ncbi:MAG: ThiF family adenylyltransferase [Candidatus Berkelbacteria bacterium]|nr:ThiF family adenylyltransferase [Candidatus Berkelbacteria bacterium]